MLPLMVRLRALLAQVRSRHQGKALEPPRARDASGVALLRYVQLTRHCSETHAYERLATFVKHYLPSQEASSLERMATHERPALLQLAQDLVAHDPDLLDKI